MTTTEEDLRPYYVDTPGARRGKMFRDAGTFEIIWMLTAFLVACISGAVHLLIPALVGVALFALAIPSEDGPLFVLPLIRARGLWIGLHDNVVVEIDEHGNIIGGGMPSVLDSLFIDNFLDEFATVYNQRDNTDTVYFSVQGWRHANAGIPQRAAAQAQIAAAFKAAIAQTGENIAYGMINGNRQFDPTQWANDLQVRYLHSDIQKPEAMDEGDRRAKDDLDDVFKRMVTKKRAKWLSLIAVTVPRPESWADLIENPEAFNRDQLRRSSLYHVLVALQRGLQSAGFVGVKALRKESLFRYLYGAWNVHYLTAETLAKGEVSGYYRVPDVDPEQLPVTEEDGSLAHVEQPFPRLIRVVRSGRTGLHGRSYDTLVMEEGSYHFVVVVKNFRRSRGLPGSMQPLTVGETPQAWQLHTQNCNTASRRLDQFLLRRRRNVFVAWFSNHRGIGTQYEEQEDLDRVASEKAAIDRIYVSGSKPVRSDHRFLGSAASLEELNEVYDNLEATLRQEDVTYYRVTGRARLAPAFLLAILGPRL